jgi:hypothetical protein
MRVPEWLRKLRPKPYVRTREEVAQTIEDFLLDCGGDWAWDDFLSIPLEGDGYLEGIRLRCGDVREEFPPARGERAYCNEEGLRVLWELVAELRAGSGANHGGME